MKRKKLNQLNLKKTTIANFQNNLTGGKVVLFGKGFRANSESVEPKCKSQSLCGPPSNDTECIIG